MSITLQKIKALPDEPGVYFFLKKPHLPVDKQPQGRSLRLVIHSFRRGEVLYIGKAGSLRDRVRSYFSKDIAETRGPGITQMVAQAQRTRAPVQRLADRVAAYFVQTVIVIAVIAILHVFVSHFAVGGGLFLVLAERKAYREHDASLLAFVRDLSRFFILLTLVFGAITGVGIWFTIGLVHPQATSSLINIFVWAWAIEWTFFVAEIALKLYVYRWQFFRDGWNVFDFSVIAISLIPGASAFTVAWVPTGMNTGVSITPQAVVISPSRGPAGPAALRARRPAAAAGPARRRDAKLRRRRRGRPAASGRGRSFATFPAPALSGRRA